MDPKDLMITNQFISPQSSSPFTRGREPNNQRLSREYAELKDFIQDTFAVDRDPLGEEQRDFESDEENDYDLLEPAIRHPRLTSALNRPQWIHTEEPLALSQGVMPILSKSINDLTKFRYRKQVISYINIDSRRRDVIEYPNPGNYRIFLNKEFRNLYSIRLESLIFRESPTPINSTNNCLIWQTNYTGLSGISDGTTVEYQANIPGAFYTLGEFSQAVEESLNSVPHNITESLSLDGIYPAFRLDIDPFTREIRFLQRLEEFVVTTYSTTVGSNDIVIRVKNQSGVAPPGPPDYPFKTTEDVPIILSGLNLFGTNFGGIPVTLLNNVPFYPNASSPTNSFSTPTYDAGRQEYIYTLTVFNPDGTSAKANQTIQTPGIVDNLVSSNLPNFPAGHPVQVLVGRAVSFSLDECSSFARFLGLQDTTEDILVHTNFNADEDQVENKIPWMSYGPGELTLDNIDYILMRIETRAKPIGTISSNLTCAVGSVVNAELENNKRGDAFFAKIIFAGSQPGDVVVRAVGGDRLFYNAPLVQLIDLDVSFFDPSGRPLKLYQNHSFVLQMVEIQEVLRDTLIDSRTGNIADVGANVATTNPLD